MRLDRRADLSAPAPPSGCARFNVESVRDEGATKGNPLLSPGPADARRGLHDACCRC
jgi:hypothetical protein